MSGPGQLYKDYVIECAHKGCHEVDHFPEATLREARATFQDWGWLRRRGLGWVCPLHARLMAAVPKRVGMELKGEQEHA